MNRIFIIAEAGVNHNGSLSIARKLVDAACLAKADAIKFQAFRAEELTSRTAPKADYQKITTGTADSQQEMLAKLQLSVGAIRSLVAYCRKKKIIFIASLFDQKSLGFLQGLNLPVYKIPSGEITNLPLLRSVGALRKKIIISTGMAYMREIADALGVLVTSGTAKNDITVLHCNTEYPTPSRDVNLRAMCAIQKRFKVNVGYSDHTLGLEVPIAAVACGARVIEKHLTLDRTMKGPDHRASIEPRDFMSMVAAIRTVERSLGDGVKRPSLSESKNRVIVRKSIVAARDIARGERFSPESITIKRPATGISPMRWDEVIGRKSRRSFIKDELIRL